MREIESIFDQIMESQFYVSERWKWNNKNGNFVTVIMWNVCILYSGSY